VLLFLFINLLILQSQFLRKSMSDTLGLVLTDYNALMALTGLVCGCLMAVFSALILKTVL
jgi:hypothetical protein